MTYTFHMSKEEMDTQTGEALREYRDAKILLAQSDRKLAGVAAAYQKAAGALISNSGEDFTSAGAVMNMAGAFDISGEPSIPVMSSDRLVEILKAHEITKNKVATLLGELRKLGFGDIL